MVVCDNGRETLTTVVPIRMFYAFLMALAFRYALPQRLGLLVSIFSLVSVLCAH